MRKRLLNLLLAMADIIAINLSIILAFAIRFEGDFFNNIAYPYVLVYIDKALAITAIKLAIFHLLGMYNRLWKYASVEEVLHIVSTSLIANAGIVSYMFLIQERLPRSIYTLAVLFDIILIGSIRFSYKVFNKIKHSDVFTKRKYKRVLIIGAGQAGTMIIKELKSHEELNSKPIGLIDDDETKLGKKIYGVSVLGDRYHIRKIVERKRIDEIIIAIPSASRTEIVGLRPGEKLYEELLMNEEGLTETKHNKIFIGKPLQIDLKVLHAQLNRLRETMEGEDEEIRDYIEHMVPTYKRIG